jgi:hypothetical protein
MSVVATPDSQTTPTARGATIERTFTGLEARLHSTGFARFFHAAFLAVWLAFWACGEAVAVWLLGTGAWSLLTGESLGPGRAPLELAPALGVGTFLSLWLAFWTVGGLAALHEFGRELWSEDRLRVVSGQLEIARRAGLFTRRRTLPRDQIRRLYRVDARRAMLAETRESSIELTRLGTPAQQDQILAALTSELQLPDPGSLPPALPAEWAEVTAPEGGRLLVKNPATRRRQAQVAWVLALPLFAGTVVLARATPGEWSLTTPAAIAAVAAAAVAWGACRLQFGRNEWRVEPGRIVQQQRFGSRVKTVFKATAISLSESKDSDNDSSFKVELITPASPPHTPKEIRRILLSQLHDVSAPRRLATWLAATSGLQLADTVKSPSASAAEKAALLRQLADTGRFGRWAARWLGSKPPDQRP